MIRHPAFPVEPWCVRETELDPRLLAQTESIFALSNGHLGWRGNLDEGEPHGIPGTYLNGFFERVPLPYAEKAYGYPESGQTIVNVTNGKLLRLFVDDEPFDVRYGRLVSHERVLDFRAGTLHRAVEWTSPAGRRVRISSTRLVSLTHRSVAAISYAVEPIGGPAKVAVQSELRANEQLPPPSHDLRATTSITAPLLGESRSAQGGHGLLVHRSLRSKLRLAAAMQHLVEAPHAYQQVTEGGPDVTRFVVAVPLEPGQQLRLVKFVAYGWSAVRTHTAALEDQVEGALHAAENTGWAGLATEQQEYLADFWNRSDVQLDGDPEVQQAIRFGLFHVLQAGARAEVRAIPAKGLTGPGYDGHAFWDTETFVLPMLTYTSPRRSRGRAPLAPQHAAARDSQGESAWPARGRLPLAHHRRRGVLELLACGDCGIPCQCRHRRCSPSLRQYHRGRGICGRAGPRPAGADGQALAIAWLLRQPGQFPHRRRHRAGRVQRASRQQRLHQPDGPAEHARRGGCSG